MLSFIWALLILALIGLGACYVIDKWLGLTNYPTINRIAGRWKAIGVTIAAIMLLLDLVPKSFTVLPPSYKAVHVRMGNVIGVHDNGVIFTWPYADYLVPVWMGSTKNEEKSSAGTSDTQNTTTTIVVTYHKDPNKVQQIYEKFRESVDEQVIDPAIRESMKAVTAKYKANDLLAKREEVRNHIIDLIREKIKVEGLVLDQTSITEFTFSNEYMKSVENKVRAEQEAMQTQNETVKVQAQTDQAVIRAKGEAAKTVVAAEADAKQKELTSRAEATALKLLRAEITPELMQLRKIENERAWIEKWNGAQPTHQFGSAPAPIFNVGK